jgi:hypothetical protein
MKKITLFVLSIVALASAASAQSVSQADFIAKQDTKGMNAVIDGVILRPKTVITEIKVGDPATVTMGSGSTANVVAKCKTPRGFKQVDVDFPANPSFAACFYMSEAMLKTVPLQENFKAQITFKGDKNLGFQISLFKGQ